MSPRSSRFAAALFAAALLGTAACGADIRNGTLTLPITLKESLINGALQHSKVEVSDERSSAGAKGGVPQLVDSITAVDFLEPNIVRVHGLKRIGGAMQPAQFDVSFAAESRALIVAITDVKIPGLTINSPEVKHLNAELQKDLGDVAATDAGGKPGAGVTAARVKGRAIELTLEVPLR